MFWAPPTLPSSPDRGRPGVPDLHDPVCLVLRFFFVLSWRFHLSVYIIHLLLRAGDIVRENPWLVSVEILNDWSDPSGVPTGPTQLEHVFEPPVATS